MKRGARRLLVAVFLTSAVFSAACLLVLRSGRPLYYTDGSQGIIASELVDAPMLVYDTPQPVAELPGPIQGRVQRLPDGRVLYARVISEGRSDLVIFDPERPELEAVAASVLNTSDHELSPALSRDGVLYFASNRPGGPGGFDLYSALYIEGGLFSFPRLLAANVNTPADEFDPAPAPDGNTLVFARRHPSVAERRSSTLQIAQLNSDLSAVPLWEEKTSRRPILPRMDREPAFGPDGVSLWFVREIGGSEPTLQRSWRHEGEFVPPVVYPELMVGGPFRSPQPSADGFQIELLRQGEAPLIYRATAREVYPWWAGQHSLEFFLFLCLLISLLLLMLLLLGSRWHQLDFITWCIILSLLLHLLIWMLLSSVEIIESWSPTPAAEDRLSVRLISMDQGSQSGGDQTEQQMDRLSEHLVMAERQDRIESQSPTTAMMQDSSQRETPAGERGEAALQSPSFIVEQVVADPTEQFAPMAGSESLQQVNVEVSAVQPAASSAEGVRTLSPSEVIEVSLPAAASLPSLARAEGSSPRAIRKNPEIELRQGQQALQSLADAPSTSDTQPSKSLETLQATDARAVAPRAATARPVVPSSDPMQARDRAAENPSTLATPASTLVAAVRQAPSGARAVRVSPRPQQLRANLDQSIDLPVTQQPAEAVEEAKLPSLRSSTALRALDPGRATSLGPRPLAAERTNNLPSAQIAAAVSSMAQASRRSISSQRRQRVLGPVSRPQDLDLRDQPAASTNDPQVAESSAAGTSMVKPSLQALTAKAVELSAARPPLRGQLRADPASIEKPAATQLPSMNRRTASTPGRSEMRLERSRSRPAAPSIADRIELGSTEPEKPAQSQLEPLAASSALAPLNMRGPTPSDLPRIERGGAQDDGRDLVSSGLRLPGSFLTMAPKREGRVLASSSPERTESLYSNRFGPKKAEALARFGGTEETERAVASGLRYLAEIQSDSGYWGSRRRDHEKYGEVYIGKTALCMLAFLGAGHTHQSKTEHSDVVSAAIEFLLAQQDEETQHFGRKTSSYSHGISTYALAECYAITGDPRLRQPLEGAVRRILDQQSNSSDTRNRGGWGYFSATLSPEDPFTRTSVSAWMIMALKSAELSGIVFPDDSKRAAKSFLWRMFDRDRNYFLYSKDPSRLRSAWRTLPASTPAGVFGLQLLGEKSSDERLTAALQFTTEKAPASYRRGSDDDFVLRATGNVYFWYYGSLATFMAGGDAWDRWNERLSTVLPKAQNLDGSFSAVGAYARYAGDTRQDRSYTTAMVVLSLEVYYRYFTPLLEGR